MRILIAIVQFAVVLLADLLVDSLYAFFMTTSPQPPPSRSRICVQSLVVSGLVGLGYGGFARLAFGYPAVKELLGIVTLSFVFLVPLAIGALAVFFGAKDPSWGWGASLGMPCLLTLVCLVGAGALGFEALICILMASPIMFTMAVFGGLVTFAVISGNRRGGGGKVLVTAFVFLPFLAAPVENLASLPHSLQQTDTRIPIAANPDRVWEHIARVAAISPRELRWSPVFAIGFPRPIEATLSREGVGGVRHASFERDVTFIETVTRWEPGRVLAFDIHADGDFIPPAAFDRHVVVGGRFLDVLSGTYVIEPAADGSVTLHLSSSHRLSTRFNWYAGLWSNWIMEEIQNSILRVIKRRCESGLDERS